MVKKNSMGALNPTPASGGGKSMSTKEMGLRIAVAMGILLMVLAVLLIAVNFGSAPRNISGW